VTSAFERASGSSAIIQKEYADAKNAFDKQDLAVASAGFADVLKSIADPDIAFRRRAAARASARSHRASATSA
jgi:hypothetical protein